MSERRHARRVLIRMQEKLSARLTSAFRADDPDRILVALLALAAFTDEGIDAVLIQLATVAGGVGSPQAPLGRDF